MCSCHRDGKPQHTDACRKAHVRYSRSAKGYLDRIRQSAREFERKTGVKP